MPYNYYSGYNPYMQAGYNPYIQNSQRQGDLYQPSLQGKVVDNIEVVKAIDIPLNNVTNYFPLANGSAIITKQLQQDGTSKVVIYKPLPEESSDSQRYITEEELREQLGELNPKDIREIKEELKNLKKRIRELTDDLEDKKEV